jgi:hypothetical protein
MLLALASLKRRAASLIGLMLILSIPERQTCRWIALAKGKIDHNLADNSCIEVLRPDVI